MCKIDLLNNIDKIHTTKMGLDRISNNLTISKQEVINTCKEIITNNNSNITKKGKNYYCKLNNIILTINTYSFTIITAHKQ